jgi:hypothetical protein
MKRRNPADPIGEKFYREVWNPEPPSDESKGLLNQLLDGDIVLTDQASVKRAGGWILVPYASNTVTRGPILSGEYSGIKKEKWRIQIDTSGAPGTGDYKVSYNGGTSWDLTDQEMIDTDEDEIRMGITEGIYIEWPAGVAQVSGEYWDLYLFPNTDTVETATIGSIELRR